MIPIARGINASGNWNHGEGRECKESSISVDPHAMEYQHLCGNWMYHFQRQYSDLMVFNKHSRMFNLQIRPREMWKPHETFMDIWLVWVIEKKNLQETAKSNLICKGVAIFCPNTTVPLWQDLWTILLYLLRMDSYPQVFLSLVFSFFSMVLVYPMNLCIPHLLVPRSLLFPLFC